MTKDDIMKMAAQKAASEISLESLEWLFQPRTLFELLLRNYFEGTSKVFKNAETSTEDTNIGLRAIELEKFYRDIKELIGA